MFGKDIAITCSATDLTKKMPLFIFFSFLFYPLEVDNPVQEQDNEENLTI